MIKSMLLQFSTHMWHDAPFRKAPDAERLKKFYPQHWERMYQAASQGDGWTETLDCDEDVWRKVTTRYAECGGEMLIINLGDAIRYKSHPEIAVSNAWSLEKFGAELARLRDLGLEPIPKLNFSTCHDAWMHEYARMVSSKAWYAFCHDIIAETCAIFGGPRLFHIGMDEETFGMQADDGYLFKAVRANTLWWHDLNFLCDEVRACGARPWMWADKLWDTDPAEFSANVPKDVLQSNWYYKEVFKFDETTPEYLRCEKVRVDAYKTLDDLGYDQVCCGSNWARDENYPGTVEYCTKLIKPEHLAGFMMAPWNSTVKLAEPWLLEACEISGKTHGKR